MTLVQLSADWWKCWGRVVIGWYSTWSVDKETGVCQVCELILCQKLFSILIVMKLAEAGLTGEILAGADQNYNIPGPHFLVHTTYLLDPRITHSPPVILPPIIASSRTLSNIGSDIGHLEVGVQKYFNLGSWKYFHEGTTDRDNWVGGICISSKIITRN